MIDEIDEQLMRLLAEDGRMSSETLGKKLSLSAATVRRRIRNLIKRDALKISALVNPAKLGFATVCVIALDVATTNIEAVMEVLSQFNEVKWVSATTGKYDVMVVASFRYHDDLLKFLENKVAKLDGIRDTETFVCLGIRKGRYMHIL
ncbi:MAG: Lrp/AsnC family transcriptional regulator [Chloroflexi bacterium]|nr:Lrp/AsnC family transcriptional regulator [Chloroflexota bacterium]